MRKVNKFYIVQLHQVEKSINLKLSNCINEQNIQLDTDQPINHTQVCKPWGSTTSVPNNLIKVLPAVTKDHWQRLTDLKQRSFFYSKLGTELHSSHKILWPSQPCVFSISLRVRIKLTKT